MFSSLQFCQKVFADLFVGFDESFIFPAICPLQYTADELAIYTAAAAAVTAGPYLPKSETSLKWLTAQVSFIYDWLYSFYPAAWFVLRVWFPWDTKGLPIIEAQALCDISAYFEDNSKWFWNQKVWIGKKAMDLRGNTSCTHSWLWKKWLPQLSS